MWQTIRLRLAGGKGLPQLALLGLCTGLLAGAAVILFRLAIELPQQGFLPGGDPENYEGLAWWWRLLLPLAGGLVIGLVFHCVARETRSIGVAHVLERLNGYQGHMPWRNAVLQFFGAAGSVISGHSVGREGPSVHLGAVSGSWLGQYLHLPNNSIRTLVGCGVAAAIAASFNTPIAGVIFAMEVVLMEYTIAGFAPVILAAVSATVLTRFIFGSESVFEVPGFDLASLAELPFFVLMGLVLGALAAAFITILQVTTERTLAWPLWLRMGLGGGFVGLCALVVPEVMGIGYDTVNEALLGQLGIGLLAAVVVFKLLATTVGLGLGLPGGLIGPTLVIGAAAGGLTGLLAENVLPEQVASGGFYALIGMGAMMGATLQAPLAALMAMLELTGNPNIILPGMLATIIALLASSQLFRQESVFLTLLRARGVDYREDPLTLAMRRIGVASVMERSFARAERHIHRDSVEPLLSSEPKWLLLTEDEAAPVLMPTVALVRHLDTDDADDEIDLMDLPAQRQELAFVNFQATLQEALETLDEARVDALAVRGIGAARGNIIGVVTREAIETYYRRVPETGAT